ncbi:MAG: TlpA family protein disulfide reductase [Chitinophagales bacterium]|nr:TlpA family protein disulfide reductase [Chitinophagales bacterium]
MNFKTLFSVVCLSLSSVLIWANNSPFPSISVKTLDGKSVNIQDYTKNGKITVVSFWATWCTPCKRELDAVHEIYEEWLEKYDVQILAITIDDARGLSKVPAMVKSKGWEFTVLADSKQELQRALNFQTIPQTFLLDQNGEIVYAHNGYNSGDELELEKKIAALVK